MASGARSKLGACCDRKSRAACGQSFALWQQATIEITRRDHSIIACSRHIYNGVLNTYDALIKKRVFIFMHFLVGVHRLLTYNPLALLV